MIDMGNSLGWRLREEIKRQLWMEDKSVPSEWSEDQNKRVLQAQWQRSFRLNTGSRHLRSVWYRALLLASALWLLKQPSSPGAHGVGGERSILGGATQWGHTTGSPTSSQDTLCITSYKTPDTIHCELFVSPYFPDLFLKIMRVYKNYFLWLFLRL